MLSQPQTYFPAKFLVLLLLLIPCVLLFMGIAKRPKSIRRGVARPAARTIARTLAGKTVPAPNQPTARFTGALPNSDPQISGITSFAPRHYGAQKRNWSIVQDDRGIIFIANSGGVLEYDSLNWRLIPVTGGGAFALAKDEMGRIFVGGSGEMGYLKVDADGLMKYKSLMHHLPQKYHGIQDRVVQVRAIPGGRMVFLFERLLVVLSERGLETYSAEDHFFSFIFRNGSLYVIDSVRGLLLAEKGKLNPVPGGELLRAYVMLPFGQQDILIVTTHKGPIVFDPHAPEAFFSPFLKTEHDFFRDNIVTCGTVLRNGNVMLGSLEKSIAVFPAVGGEGVSPDTGSNISIGPDQGLPDTIVYGLFQDAAGNTWVGMDNGISLLRPPLLKPIAKTPGAAMGKDRIPFAALIRGVRKFADDSVIFQGAYYDQKSRIQVVEQQPHQVNSFSYAYNGFRFSFCTNSFDDTHKILYQCILDEQEPQWSNWNERTVREYTNLIWGRHTLRVRAKNAFGQISREARFTFIIDPPWYERWWFLASQITFIFLVLLASRLMDRVGHAPKLSQYMIIFAVIIIFEYFNGFISPFVGRYSDGIVFFEMMITAVLSIIISPAEDFILNLMKKIIRGKEIVGIKETGETE